LCKQAWFAQYSRDEPFFCGFLGSLYIYIYIYIYIFLSQVALIPKGARMRRARKKYIYGLHDELVLTFEKIYKSHST
jgi:hypothetical protein